MHPFSKRQARLASKPVHILLLQASSRPMSFNTQMHPNHLTSAWFSQSMGRSKAGISGDSNLGGCQIWMLTNRRIKEIVQTDALENLIPNTSQQGRPSPLKSRSTIYPLNRVITNNRIFMNTIFVEEFRNNSISSTTIIHLPSQN